MQTEFFGERMGRKEGITGGCGADEKKVLRVREG